MADGDDVQAAFLRRMQTFLTVAVVTGFFAVIAALLYVEGIPTGVREVLLILIGALLASFKEVFSYFLGSSAGSARKGEQMAATAAAATTPMIEQMTATGTTPMIVKTEGQ